MSKAIKNTYEKGLENAISQWGRNVFIIYGTTAECNSCGYDPVNKESTNSFCSTCDGNYYYLTENTCRVKGVLYSFLKSGQFMDYAIQNFGYVPIGDARLTMWLEDVLVNTDSATGKTYVDKAIRLEVDGKKYEVEDTKRTGIERLKVYIVSLKEIK